MDIKDLKDELEYEEKRVLRARTANRAANLVIMLIFILALVFTVTALWQMLKLTNQGINGVEYHDFNELLKINPDTVAWIRLDDTHIDHPVVQGKDNFEYLDKNFYGNFYAGGTLFLDYRNDKGFNDPYNIIHGHHMEGGAMFGDLSNFLKKGYFKEHKTGVLLTPKFDYDLEVIAVGSFNAYDDDIYYPLQGKKIPYKRMLKDGKYHRGEIGDSQLLALSTCSGSLNDTRTVVFCKMYNKHRHE